MTRRASFSAGDSVIIRQISRGEVGLLIREIGAGTLAATPEVGTRLRIEMRRGRGLASSPISRMEYVGLGQLAIRTRAPVYMISDIAQGEGPDRNQIEQVVAALLGSGMGSAGRRSEWETEYVRLKPSEPKEARRIRVTRVRGGHEEFFGEGELLGEVELGDCMRFTAEDGRIRGTSEVQMIRQTSPSCLELSTGNSQYLVEFLSGRLPL